MLNEKFIERMRVLLGNDGLEQYLSELQRPSPRALRVNTLKGNASSITDIPLTPVPYADNCYYFDRDKIGSHPLHHAGLIYIQEPGAMIPIASVKIQSNWKILDTCSAPGGKSLQAAALLGEDGFIISNEINLPRAKVMLGNFERMGVKRYAITTAPVGELTELFPYCFDLVIADAPCSGEGMFRKEEAAVSDWSEDAVAMCAERQRDILQNASRAVKGGGYLLYSTCTFSPEENEYTVNEFLKNNPDFEICPPDPKILGCTVSGIGCEHFRRFYPHIAPGEGQFCALLKRSGDELELPDITSALSPLTKEEEKLTRAFLDDTLIEYDCTMLHRFKERIVYADPKIPVPDRLTYAVGVTLGEIKKGVFRPHHQMFSAMSELFKRRISLPLGDSRLNAYLFGESFEHSCENGWCSVLADGIPLGGGKAVNGQIKNHYPKGLRIQH